MRKFILLAVLFVLTGNVFSQTNSTYRYQQGYYKTDGTWVQPHYKTENNSTNWDNYSTTPNTNYFTQEKGSRARDYSPEAYNYGQDRVIYEGPKGGQYYYNDSGNKVYVPKRSTTTSPLYRWNN